MHRRVLRDNPSDSFSINGTYGSMGNQDAIYQINYQTPRGRVVQEMGRMYWAGITSTQSNYTVVSIDQANVPRYTSFVGRVVNGLVNLVPAAHASEGNYEMPVLQSERNESSFYNRFYDINNSSAMHHIVAIGRGLESAVNTTADGIVQVVSHPVDTVMGLAITAFDGYNALGDRCFGISTEGSRIRNSARGSAFLDTSYRFENGNSVVRTEMLSAGAGNLFFAYVTGSGAVQVYKLAGPGLIKAGNGVKSASKHIVNNLGSNSYKKTQSILPSEINFSQESISYTKYRGGLKYNLDDIMHSMINNGWVGAPIDVVQMEKGILTTIDNSRVFVAKKANINVKANVRKYNERLPSGMLDRFEHPKIYGAYAKTWGEAIEFRLMRQSYEFSDNYFPNGTYVEPKVTGMPKSKF
jgi:hypothetical protein